ncbi:hypothetical protein I7I53_03253 [Histoplasma capsulatum var. duboisii H88]|uniref:Uncharacterized protein n=1 Tax=Ajellomyces capsulatus (strain H88) TaxID=544711 RepID=A0A8A1LNI7_AJEC8|nr:hypothetical protein I7I53_03253 [Histoplasma capsulatum var. duboisii H88]
MEQNQPLQPLRCRQKLNHHRSSPRTPKYDGSHPRKTTSTASGRPASKLQGQLSFSTSEKLSSLQDP